MLASPLAFIPCGVKSHVTIRRHRNDKFMVTPPPLVWMALQRMVNNLRHLPATKAQFALKQPFVVGPFPCVWNGIVFGLHAPMVDGCAHYAAFRFNFALRSSELQCSLNLGMLRFSFCVPHFRLSGLLLRAFSSRCITTASGNGLGP